MYIVNSSPPVWCQSLSVPLYTPSLCWCSTYIFISKIQIHLANKWSRLLKHFKHFFTVDMDNNPGFLMRNVQSCPSSATMQQGCQNSHPFAASNLTDIALHSHTRLWLPAHHTLSSESGPADLERHPDTCTHRRNLLACLWRIDLPKKHPVYRWALKLVEKAWRLQQWWLMKRHTHTHLCHRSCC